MVIVGVALTATLPGAALAQQHPTQVIPRAEIEAAGWTRLSELVFALRGAARTSVDGITVIGNVGGVPTAEAAPGGDDMLVVVDGQPMPIGLAGVQVLDLLPVSLTQLDSVTVHRGPAFVGGRLAMNGAMHLHTARALRGFHASASHYSGNEVGDAGPFTFTEQRTPNVDNSGPFHQGRVAWGAATGYVDAAIRRWTDNLTDPRLIQRYEAATGGELPELWVRHVAPTLRAGISTSGTRHDLLAGFARLRGTFFVPPAREDQALSNDLWFAGLSGGGAVADALVWGYRASASEGRSAAYGSPLPSTLAHRRRRYAADASASGTVGAVLLNSSASVTHHALLDAPARANSLTPWWVTDGAFALDVTADAPLRPRATGTVGTGVGGARAAAMLALRQPLDSATALEARLAWAARAYGDDGAWIDLELLGLGDFRRDPRRTATAELEFRRMLPGGAELRIAGAGRRETGIRLLTPDSTTAIPIPPSTVGPPLSMTVAEARWALELRPGGRVHGGAAYRFAGTIAGAQAARDAHASLPRHLLDADIVLRAARDVRVRSAIHLASATRWTGGDAGLLAVPAVNRLDLSLEKWMLRDRLRIQVLARNLLNDVERYHPLGADFRLRVFAGATLSY